MIKLFNKIRRQMLSDNKMGRYLKYAIGEIILVMIGILLALQVNTWNNNRELKKEEAKILKSLHQEFSENLAVFDKIYKNHLNRKESIEVIMLPNVRALPLDSIRSLLNAVGSNYTFDPYQGIYNAVINSGKIELISNDSLKIKTAKFQDLLNDYKEEEFGTMDFVQKNLYPYQLDGFKLDFNALNGFVEMTDSEKIKLKQNFIERIDSNKYNNLLLYIHGYMRDIFTEGPKLREEMASIINLLDEEIEKHN